MSIIGCRSSSDISAPFRDYSEHIPVCAGQVANVARCRVISLIRSAKFAMPPIAVGVDPRFGRGVLTRTRAACRLYIASASVHRILC